MPRNRVRAVLAVAVAVTVLASAGVAVVERRRRAAGDRPARRHAATTSRSDPAAVPGSGAGDSSGPGAGRRSGDDERKGDASGGGLLRTLLDALGGGGDGASGGATAALLEDCASAFASAGPGGLAGLLPAREERPASAGEQVRSIATALEELRGLRFSSVPAPVFVTPGEMGRRVRAQVAKELSPKATADEARALIALGALPPGADLRALTLKALGDQVAGYYDTVTGELVVGRSGTSARLDGQSRIVLAHELDHAVVDQVLGLPVDDGQPPPGTEDTALARLALVEGDASLAMQLYGLAHVALLEQLQGLTGAVASQEQLAELPHHLQRSLTFPYLEGLSFTCALHAAGGWPAVDRAYGAPPTTTAQVLFPERYQAGEAAVDPRDPTAPGGPWRASPRRALGAAELQWLLEAPGGDPGRALDHPAERAAAWAGGELQVWSDGDRTAAGVALVQRAGETPLCATMVAWYAAAFPGGRRVDRQPGEELAIDGPRQDSVVRCDGTDVRTGIGPDLATARAVAR